LESPEPGNSESTDKITEKPQVALSRFKNKRDGVMNKKMVKKELPQLEVSEEEIDWVNSQQQKNWKQRKSIDRTIIDLAERIFTLSKKQNAPTREMIISFLASLSGLQLEFMDDLADSLLPSPEVPTQQNQVSESVVTPVSEKRIPATEEASSADTPPELEHPQNSIPPSRQQQNVQQSTLKQEEYTTPAKPEPGEYDGVSDEEMALHRKILETQKKYNISYDHAAGMVLK
jgi:hypothetical protein